MQIEDIPKRYRDLYEQAASGRSRKAAIRAYCLMCVDWNAEEVRRCSMSECPLYPHRLSKDQMYKDRKDASEPTLTVG